MEREREREGEARTLVHNMYTHTTHIITIIIITVNTPLRRTSELGECCLILFFIRAYSYYYITCVEMEIDKLCGTAKKKILLIDKLETVQQPFSRLTAFKMGLGE